MDLISCRNLLIYLSRDAQQQVFETLHFALKPEGRLFLGSSEAIDDDSPLFQVVDKKHRIYVRRAAVRIGLPVPTGPSSLLRAIQRKKSRRPRPPWCMASGSSWGRPRRFTIDRMPISIGHRLPNCTCGSSSEWGPPRSS